MYLPDSPFDFLFRKSHFRGEQSRQSDIFRGAFSEQRHFGANRLPIGQTKDKRSTFRVQADVGQKRAVIGINAFFFPFGVSLGKAVDFFLQFPAADDFFRGSFQDFTLCFQDILFRTECLDMLSANARKRGVIGFYQSAEFRNVPSVPRAHFRDKDFLFREIGARHGLGDSDGRIEGFGRRYRLVFYRQKGSKNILDGGFSVASHDGHAHNAALFEFFLRPADEFRISRIFVQSVEKICKA